MAKKKANASGKINFVLERDREKEDIHYDIQWLKVIIRGSPELEEEEYQDSLKFYEPLGKIFKKDIPVDNRMKEYFKTKVLSSAKVDEAYKKGYGSTGNKNISNKLLEMGILMHIEKIDDYNNREEEVIPDF